MPPGAARATLADGPFRCAALAGVVTAAVVGATLLLLTPVFEQMPLNALGAIVIAGVIGLLHLEECAFLWRVRTMMQANRRQASQSGTTQPVSLLAARLK